MPNFSRNKRLVPGRQKRPGETPGRRLHDSLFRDVFERSPTGQVLLDREGKILRCNYAFSKILEERAGALQGRSFCDLCAEGESLVFHDHLKRLTGQDHAPFELEIPLRKSLTDTTWVHLQATLLEEAADKPAVMLSIQDATAYHEVQQGLEENLRQTRRSEKTLSDLLDAIPQALFILNGASVILFCNHAAELFFETSLDTLLGEKLGTLIPDGVENVEAFLEKSKEPLHGNKFSVFNCQARALHSNGTCFPVSVQLRPLGWGNSSESLCILQDLSKHEELERRIEEANFFDTLTGLPNRQYLRHHLEHLLRDSAPEQRRIALLFCDLDRFKSLNDSLGHDIGDEILVETGQRLLATLYPNDLLCRYSGDKFVLVPERPVTAEIAAKIAEKVLQAVARPMVAGSQELFLTASIGIAMAPDDGETLDGLLKNAESAMYRAKKQGGNTTNFYTRKHNAHSMDRLKLVNALHRALDNREFFLSFQPQVDIQNFRVVGAEALLRWHSPARGVLMPGDFIPLLEETGLIIPVGTWVLEMACKQAMRWRTLIHPRFRIAVNVSARQLRDPGLAD